MVCRQASAVCRGPWFLAVSEETRKVYFNIEELRPDLRQYQQNGVVLGSLAEGPLVVFDVPVEMFDGEDLKPSGLIYCYMQMSEEIERAHFKMQARLSTEFNRR